jgi:predicted nucleic acid-binding protein
VGLTLLDSSAVVAYLTASDTLHEDAVEAIERSVGAGARPVVSAVTWTELLHGARRQYRSEAVIREFAEDFGVQILPVDASVAERAASLQAGQRHPRRLRTPDALVLATAEVVDDVDLVVAGDERWTKVSGTTVPVRLLVER